MDYFDCHADTLTQVPEAEDLWKNTCCLDLERVHGFAGRYTQIFALFQDREKIKGLHTKDAFLQMYKRAMELLEGQAAHAVWCTDAAGMKKAHADGKAAVFLAVEDVSVMGDLAERIKELGIRFALPAWNYENAYACGAVADQAKGLTKEGRSLVRRFLDEGIVLDISHLSDQGVEDIFLLTDRPVMASHSNVRDVCSHPRNLKKEQIRELVRRRGLIGLNFYRTFVGDMPKLADVLCHADAVLELGGADVLALGGDFDGCGDQFPEGIAGVQSIPSLWEAFEKNGFGREIMEKIFFRNGARFLEENLG